jgi:3-hydroxyisobutyrate dehydrogenase
MIAFIGTGLLGANFTKALLKKGKQVNVWNRTADKAKALEADGAKAFENITDAVKDVDRIHMTLKDDDSVNEILEQMKPALKPGVIIIDHTTTSPDGAAERTEKWKKLGFTYVHAPVFMGPPNALESTGTMLISGDQELIKKLQSELSQMTGTLLNLGTEVSKAAGMKLIGNLFLISMSGALIDSLALAKDLKIPGTEVSALFEAWNPAAMIPARMKRMMAAEFSKPSWELKMARKDARLMMEASKHGDAELHVIPAMAALMDKYMERGHQNDDWMVIAKDVVS